MSEKNKTEKKSEKKVDKKAELKAEQKAEQKAEKKADKKSEKKVEQKMEQKPRPKDYKPRLKEFYFKEVVPRMQETFKYKNPLQVPKILKITVNCVTRDAVSNGKVADLIKDELRAITGQAPFATRAKKSIATFKVREGQALGAAVTLRGDMMYEFLDRLVSLTLPRVRDFRGVSPKAFDGRGNYTLGIKEQIVFPEINYDKIDKSRGLGVCITTSALNDNEGRELLKLFGMPFREN